MANNECGLLRKREVDNGDGTWSWEFFCIAAMPKDLDLCKKNNCKLKEENQQNYAIKIIKSPGEKNKK